MNLSLAVSIGWFAVLITIWIIWRKRRFSLFKRYGIPGPKPTFWTGNLKEFNERREKCPTEWKEKYGNCFGFYMGAKPMLVVCDVELLKLIQIKEFKSFANRDPILPDEGITHPAMHQSLFSLRDSKWKNVRTIISPAFSSGKLKKMMPIVESATELFLKKIGEKGNEVFNIVPLFKNLSFDIIGKISFGIDTNVQNNDSNKFIESIYRAFNSDTTDVTAFLSICFPELEPLPCMIRSFTDITRYYLNKPSFRTIVDSCKQIIHTRKLNPKERKPDLLQNMIDANVSSDSLEEENADMEISEKKLVYLDDFTVIGNSMGFMVAGYEGTSLVLEYCVHHLATNQKIQNKLREEINSVVGNKVTITYDDINDMQYLDQVFSEVLRLAPFALTGVNRKTEEEFEYKNMVIPKGISVLIPTTLLNTDPNYWTEPTKFIPERFSPENNIDPIHYQPFGAGPRICIAMRFAHIVIKQILVSLLKKFRLEYPEDCKEIEWDFAILLVRPKHGIRVRVIPL